jgi:multiple sugar transport system substrate-binding protein
MQRKEREIMRTGSKIIMSLSAGALLAGASATSLMAADITITMAAPDWPPTRFMKEEFDKTYQSPDGHNTTLDMDFIPWPSFYERVAASLTSGEQKYQMIVTDRSAVPDRGYIET